MSTVVTSFEAADVIRSLPVAVWLGEGDNKNGFPNFPLYVNDEGVAQKELETATKCLWDGAFGSITRRLMQAIDADPSKVTSTDLTRTQLIELYPEVNDVEETQGPIVNLG